MTHGTNKAIRLQRLKWGTRQPIERDNRVVATTNLPISCSYSLPLFPAALSPPSAPPTPPPAPPLCEVYAATPRNA